MSDSLGPHGLQHARPLCSSLSPRVNSCLLSRWCHPTISSSVTAFSIPRLFPASGSFSNDLALRIRWPKYWSFSFSISPSNEYSGLISFRIAWLDLPTVQGTLKSLLQHHNSKASRGDQAHEGVTDTHSDKDPGGNQLGPWWETRVGRVVAELKSPHDPGAVSQEEEEGRSGGQDRLHLAHKVNKIQEELSFFGEWKPMGERSGEKIAERRQGSEDAKVSEVGPGPWVPVQCEHSKGSKAENSELETQLPACPVRNLWARTWASYWEGMAGPKAGSGDGGKEVF